MPVANAGFENARPAALPSGWSLDGPAPAGSVARRAEGGHRGTASIEFAADAPGALAVFSDTVTLEIGHLYRLSGWVRTRGAKADPLARYPTAVAATSATDRVRLDLGRNGTATGRAWFDDVSLAEVGDVTEAIPLERVRWEGPAFWYEDRGWIYVHVERAPRPAGGSSGSWSPTRRPLTSRSCRSAATRRTMPSAGARCGPSPTR